MLQWLRLTVFLFLCAAVHGRELECYEEVVYSFYCTNATNQQNAGSICLVCKIVHQELSESDEVIFIDIKNHTTDAKVVLLNGGDVNKLPIFIQKKNNKQITEVELSSTNTHVLNSQFFGNSCENLIKLGSEWNLELAVEAFAFQNCKNLEFLDLSKNRNSSNIAPDAFRGLHKLIKLNLNFKGLSFLLTDWFQDLNNLEALRLDFNKLPEIPENAFKALTKLKQLEIGGNEIEIITRNMFKHNEQLQIVYLNNNKIKEIQTGSFKHLSQLTELNLAKNICVDKEFKGKTLDEIAKELTECYPTSSCVIPQTQNGIIVSIDDDLTQVPGDFYETSGLVKVVCDPTFTQIHDKANQTTNRCVKTNWEDQQWPTCQKLCPKQEINDESFLASCDRDGEDFPCSGQLLPGIRAIIHCQSGFKNPKGLANPKLICEESGNWSQSAHKCEKIEENVTKPPEEQTGVSCPFKNISGLSILSHCEFNDTDVNCTGHLPPGTKATIRCHFGYKKPSRVKSELTCEASGEWSSKGYKCQPICGRVASHSIPLQINGKDTNVTEVPWHVGIYENDEQICGGTIISERVVITAAHCFSQSIDGMHDIDYKTFKVGAGKIVRGLNASETQKTQIRNVVGVEISDRYDGSATWWADIAAIIIEGHFEYYQHIMPACVEFIKNRDDWYPKNDSKALVAGWGLDEEFKSSDTLQSFDIPVVDFDSCLENAPEDFESKVVEDKICAGYVDSNGNLSKVVCKGDSGGGLLIPQTAKGKKQYHLQGVVSNSQYTKVACDTSYYTLFTNVQHFKNLILKALKMSKILPAVTGQ